MPRFNLIKPSTRAFVREARRKPDYSLFDFIHGYVYGRWIYQYIGTGLGATRLARIGAPLLNWLKRVRPARPLSEPAPKRRTTADTYHGKVVTHAAAKKLVTVNRSVDLTNLEHVVPFDTATDIILRDPDHIAVLDCPCRSARENPCLPLDVCLVVGEPFVGFVEDQHPERARRITSEQAIAILAAEHERGHVHHAFFKDAMLGRFYAICNCCACCCGAMNATRNGIPMVIPSGYIVQVDGEACAGCGACAEYCQFEALSIGYDFAISVDEAACMGCGVCVDQCDLAALTLTRNPAHSVPLELDVLMAEAAVAQAYELNS